MDCLYDKLNSEIILKEYEGKNSNTIKLNVDNIENNISAEVIKTPSKLTKSL